MRIEDLFHFTSYRADVDKLEVEMYLLSKLINRALELTTDVR